MVETAGSVVNVNVNGSRSNVRRVAAASLNKLGYGCQLFF